jgi:hypothetical protein
VLALEVERALIPLAPDDLELFGEHRDPLRDRRERKAVGAVLVLEPGGSKPQLDPPAARDVICGDGAFRQNRRMPEGHRRDQGAEPQLRRDRRQSGERAPGVE